VAAGTSDRTHSDAVYRPAPAAATPLGASFKTQPAATVPPFDSRAAQRPLWPPGTCASVTAAPEPDVFHPQVDSSNVGLATSFGVRNTKLDALDDRPSVSVTVTVTR